MIENLVWGPREWSLLFSGFLGGVIYTWLIRPMASRLRKRFKDYWLLRKCRAQTKAYNAGYGWAWTAFMVEGQSVDNLIAMTCGTFSGNFHSDAFYRGASDAINVIEHFNRLQNL